ncbi:MAG TPA: bifunctional diguanylate cyclase/phosphodiesterase [Mycobacteriales bacterium]|nr:bifunctional diguanylate cyclase/phosphodiesterase [Mycobacteriales bacterium]
MRRSLTGPAAPRWWSLLAVAPWLSLLAVVSLPGDRGAAVSACLCATTAASAATCWARALTRRTDRFAWVLLSSGWSAYALGFVIVLYLPQLQSAGPHDLNLSDTVSLLLYPCGWCGLVLLTRAGHRRNIGLLLDAGIVGCAGAAAALAWAALSFPSLLLGSPIDVVYALAYPVGGATLLVVLFTGSAAVHWRLDAEWSWLAAGLVLMTLGDALYGARSGAGTFAFGSLLDPLYTAGPAFTAVAAWRRPAAAAPVRARVGARLFAPAAGMVIALGLLVLDHSWPLPLAAVGLAACAGLLGVGRSVTFLRQEVAAEQELREALTDDLTGLWNRRALLNAVQEAVSEGRPCGLVLVDMSGVDQVNDALGHDAGDALLVQVAERLQAVVGPRLTARLAGDEFAVMTQGGRDGELLVRPLLGRLAEPVELETVTVGVGPLAGSSDCPTDEPLTAGELLRRGRVALDTARRTSRPHVAWTAALDEGALERLALAHELQSALELDQILVHHQPKVSCLTGRVHSLEALARWQHPRRGLLGPAAFVLAAESAGLLPALTRSVLALSLRQVRELRRDHPDLQVAVNLGAPDLLDTGLVEHVELALSALGLPPSAVRFEVTETVVMSEPAPVLATLHRLRALGVGISLDDYGTGLASLSYVRDLPIDELKIDRSFVQGMTTDRARTLIVVSTVELAHGLGLSVVAEGVEDLATLDALRQHGCDLVQGYLLGPPAPVDALDLTGIGARVPLDRS